MRQEDGQDLARMGGQPCWAVILAGGEGMRLRPLVRQVFGADRPKQYVRLLGPRTLLRQTLDRVSLAIKAYRVRTSEFTRPARGRRVVLT